MSVAKWRKENNIPFITYRNRQRKVFFKDFSHDLANMFVKLIFQPEISATTSIVATISTKNSTADIHNGVDEGHNNIGIEGYEECLMNLTVIAPFTRLADTLTLAEE